MMPLQTRFHPYDPERPPEQVGVYELGWQNRLIVYIGQGIMRDRLREHARGSEKRFSVYRCWITNDRRRSKQIERREQRAFVRRHGRLPTYNDQIG
jgi:hypothetical protein